MLTGPPSPSASTRRLEEAEALDGWQEANRGSVTVSHPTRRGARRGDGDSSAARVEVRVLGVKPPAYNQPLGVDHVDTRKRLRVRCILVGPLRR